MPSRARKRAAHTTTRPVSPAPAAAISQRRPARNARKCSVIANATNGNDIATPTQKRRVMSCNSGLAGSSAAGVIGSSAMPQIGQLPGALRTISRMHRAGPFIRGVYRLRLRRNRWSQIAPRIGYKPLAAAISAEMIGAAGVLGLVRRSCCIDRHPADRVADAVRNGGRRCHRLFMRHQRPLVRSTAALAFPAPAIASRLRCRLRRREDFVFNPIARMPQQHNSGRE